MPNSFGSSASFIYFCNGVREFPLITTVMVCIV